MDELKFLEEIRNWEHPRWYGRVQVEERVTLTFMENQKDLFHKLMIHFRLPVKLCTISGPCRAASYTAITLNHEANFARRETYSTEMYWRNQNYSYEFGCQAREAHWWYWNIDGSRDLSDFWTGCTQFALLDEEAPDGYTWSGGRLTSKQFTSRPDDPWPELWKSMGKHAKLKEKQKWAEEKIHLDNTRKLRGIYFIDPEDTEFEETIKDARKKKLETSVALLMPFKILENCGSGGASNKLDKVACILEVDESTRIRLENSIPHHHEDRIAGKGDSSLFLCFKFGKFLQ